MAGSHHPDLPTSLPVWPPPAASKRNSSLGGKWLKVGKHERGGGLRCLAGRSGTANTGDTTLRGPPLGIQHSTRHLSLCAEIPLTCKVRVGCSRQQGGAGQLYLDQFWRSRSLQDQDRATVPGSWRMTNCPIISLCLLHHDLGSAGWV